MSRIGKSVLTGLVFVCAALTASTSAQVVINEIHYAPANPNAEFVELYNTSASAVNLSGWSIIDAFTINFGAVSIPGHGYLVLAKDPAVLQTATGYVGALQWTVAAGAAGQLSDGGEVISLRNAVPTVVDTVNYDDAAPWTTAPDNGAGPTLELKNPVLDNNNGASWAASLVAYGSPGAQNTVFTNASTVQSEVPTRRTAVASMPTVSVTFSGSVTGVAAGNLTVGGSAATSVSGTGAGPYVFSGYAAPSSPGSVTIVLTGGGNFAGDTWTVSTGIVAVINELHYHPFDVDADAEYLEIYNAGPSPIDMSNWTFSSGIVGTVPPSTFLPVGGYIVFAKIPSLVQARTGYVGAIAWTSGSLSNSGETVAISDIAGNVMDSVPYTDSGSWPTPPDGDGPSAELINPAMPNQYGGAWRPSVGNWGTPGAANSTFIAAPPPIINDPKHTPILPLPNQSITVTALVLDDGVSPPTVTLYYRQDFDPTISYSSTPMLDDGAHGDGVAGDGTFGATVPGLPSGARLDFTIRADDGTNVSAGPSGHNTLTAGQYPAQTYLAEFGIAPTTTDLPHYHLITTQRTRSLQDAHNEDEYDASFVHCNAANAGCVLSYNIVERYRGQSSLNQHPHSFRVGFSASAPLQSEMGFPLKKLNVMAQQPDRQGLGYQFFREAFSHGIPTHTTQFVRFLTNPVSHGGAQELVYNNAEAEDADFTESEGGLVTPLRWPGVCTVSFATCSNDADCGGAGGTCFDRDSGNLYKGVHPNADLQYLGTDENSYRIPYEKQTNETEDDFTDVIALTYALDPDTTSDANFEASANAMLDENEWARYFAVQMLLVNQEGGIYRDTGDDYLVYIEPPGSPLGPNVKILPRDMDSVFGGFGTFNQETIWRTATQIPQRFLRHNAYAGRFVGAICDLLDTDFTPAVMNPRIDALPNAIADAAKKAQFKAWVTARISFVNNEIVRTTTLTGVPASPYTAASAVINLSGQLNQRGTYRVLVNGSPISNYSVFNHTWASSYTLVPGPNQITVQSVDVNGAVLDQATASVLYDPPVAPTNALQLVMPKRMINDKSQTLRANILDSLGRVVTSGCFGTLGTITVNRVSDNAVIPITLTFFDNHLPVPDDSIRFYHGVGSASFTLDGGASVPAGDYRVTVTIGSLSASRVITVVSGPTWRVMPSSLSGANLVWGPDENIRISSHHTDIPSGSTLTINPGTLVMVDTLGSLENGTLIIVNGQLAVDGTQDKPVHFFSERGPAAMIHTVSGSLSNADAWRGIDLNGSGSSHFNWMFLTGAGNGVVTSHPRPPIVSLFGTHNLTVEDSVFVDSTGMMFQSPGTGTYTIKRSLVSRTGIGGEFLSSGHTLLIEDSWFTGIGRGPTTPQRYDGDGLHVDGGSSNQTIKRCIIADIGDDAIDHFNSNFTVEDSIIHDVADKATSLTGGSATFRNSLIFNAPTGIRGTARVYNSTITTGSPIQTPQIVQESIIWSSSIPTCAGDIDYTIVGNAADLGCGTGNQSVDPQFTNTGQCDYRPLAGSPALTSGPTGGRIGWLGYPSATACTLDSQCNDNNACSVDTCSLGVCNFRPIAGCGACTTNADCNDSNACTADVCGALGTCQASQPLNCDDSDACTTDSCDPQIGCQHTAANCDDSNVCTNDSCSGGVCQHANNTASCTDGNLCTTADTCGGGTCGGTPVSCPGGSTCSPATGQCVAGPVTVTFRDGTAGYTGTQDTYLTQNAPGTVQGALDNWRWDTENPTNEFGLIRFDNIIGPGVGQIPTGSTIQSATLTLEVTNGTVAPNASVNESTVDWAEATATWNNFGGDAGVQADEYLASPQYNAPLATGSQGTAVTASVQAWASALRSNFGWVFRPANTDGAQVDSAEFATVALRPTLTVVYSPPVTGCTTNLDCNDNNACNGVETCVSTVCQPGTPLNCDDSNVCTTDSCVPATGCAHANNTASCSDGNACTANDTCAGGSCVGGAAPNCDDSNPCTNDSCNISTGCVHANNTASCSDGSLCTTADVCSGGTCSGTPVSCPIGSACNPGTGTCQSGPSTVTFQQGFSGYSGSADTYIDAALGSQASASPIVADSSPEEQVLLRFDGLFGSGPNQIPSGSTISSATLTLWVGAVTNDQSANPVNFHQLLHAWSDASVWAAYGVAPWNATGGVQNDGVDALNALTATVTMNTVATSAAINVTSSLQAWVANPATNFGWVILPTGTDGLRLESSESTTASNSRRPLLSVTFTPPATGCNVNSDCNDDNPCTTDTCSAPNCVYTNNTLPCGDGQFCNGNEVCGGGSCQPGTPVNCNDGVSCSTDSCNEATDACEHTACTMTVSSVGSRWLDVTPPAGLASVALRVGAPGLGCLPKYVAANGALTGAPVFQSSVQWGTVKVGDRLIVPSTSYTVQAEVTAGTPIGSGVATTWAWGNGNNVDDVNVFDIVCALDGFQSVFTNCTPYGVDQNSGAVSHPVAIDMSDVLAVLDAFSGSAYPDTDPCGALVVNASQRTDRVKTDPSGTLTLVPSATTVAPFGTVRIDVFGDGIQDVRAYQVAVEWTGGTIGTFVPVEASVDGQRADRVFGDEASFPVADTAGSRLGGAQWHGAANPAGRVYLGSFVFRAGARAQGTFHLGFRAAETLLWSGGSGAAPTPARISGGVDITVTGRKVQER